ncbi:MAG: DUF418 domain-containing protein [Psychrobacillus sp.]
MKRIEVIDALRGFALLGILLVNINFFNESLQAISLGGVPLEGRLNKTIDFFTALLVEGKFMLLFSFLFGYGASILYMKSTTKNIKFMPLYFKRMLALLFFGLLHGLLLWYGDILTTYAIAGTLLFLFLKRKLKTILIWSIVLLSLVPILLGISTWLGSGTGDYSSVDYSEEIRFSQEMDMQIYGKGSFTEIATKRSMDFVMSFFNMILFIPQILGIFLLGAYFGKRKLLEKIQDKNRSYLILGVLATVSGLILELPMLLSISSNLMLEMIGVFIAGPLLMLGYVSFFYLAFVKYKKFLSFFSYMGRLGFSMYILQSGLCSLIFYSYGLGLFGEMKLWQTTMIAISIYLFQLFLSYLWINYFKFQTGPLEYLWRLFYRGRGFKYKAKNL